MTILVTGGAGFIGSHLVDRLLSQNHEVVCLDNFDTFYDPSIKRGNIRRALGDKNYTLIEGDIRDPFLCCSAVSAVKKLTLWFIWLRGQECVHRFCSRSCTYDVNVTGTLRFLEAMRLSGVKRLVFGSSSSVYGNNPKVPFAESDPVDNPISPYAATKKAGELLCHTYHHLHGFDVFCLRFFTVYGPRQRPEMAIHKFVKNIMDGEPITMFGDGSTMRDYTFVDDIVQGIAASIQNVKGYEILNLGESNTISLANLISLLEKKLGKKAIIKQMPEQPGDVKLTNADITKAKRMIGYNPKTSIEEGLKRFCGVVSARKKESVKILLVNYRYFVSGSPRGTCSILRNFSQPTGKRLYRFPSNTPKM